MHACDSSGLDGAAGGFLESGGFDDEAVRPDEDGGVSGSYYDPGVCQIGC